MSYEETICPNCEEISFIKECSQCSLEICDMCKDPEYNMCSECSRRLLDVCPNCEEISFIKECSECSLEICDICQYPEYNMCSECRRLLEKNCNF